MTTLGEKAEDTFFELTVEQEQEIIKSKNEIKNGLLYSYEDLVKEIQSWRSVK